MPDDVAERGALFARDYLVWIAVRHFLSADLLEELARATVGVVTDDQLSLDDLFDSARTIGLPEVSAWFARPRAVEGAYCRALQDVVRQLVWTGDWTFGWDAKKLTLREATHLSDIAAAFRLASSDLATISWLRPPAPVPASLNAISEAIASAESLVDGADRATLIEILSSETGRFEAPLDAIVAKHLGDLCADADRWQLASAAYDHAADLLRSYLGRPWAGLNRFLRDATEQSQAASMWALEGAAAADEAYRGLIARGNLTADPLPLLNATTDALNARLASKDGLFASDLRPVVALAPLLVDTHDVSNALAGWRKERYDDASRWFWATLRRQTALGSVSAGCVTKANFGHAMIDQLGSELDRHRVPGNFRLGLKLLVESGDSDVVNRIGWSERFVAAYVDADVIAGVLAQASRAPGFVVQRMLVVMTLLKCWTMALPRDATALAHSMLTNLATVAGDVSEDASTDRKVSDAALKSLSEIAQARPEMMGSATSAIATAVAAQVTKASFIIAGDALSLAHSLIESLDNETLSMLADTALRRLATFEPAQSPWPFVRPAIAFLSAERILALCAEDASLRAMLPPTLIEFALESESEHASLLFLLRDVDPAWLEGKLDKSRLDEVITELRGRAHKINSSRAPDDVTSLLIAPAFSGTEAVRDALGALQAIVASATRERPAISFECAYRPVMLATDTRAEIAREAPLPDEEVLDALHAIATSLECVWERAEADPLIFAGFAIPQRTTPNTVLVHNWTFASIGLARSLDREAGMARALDAAARNDRLGTTIAIARATRFAAGDAASFDAVSIRNEGKEPFYAALGKRLLLIADLPPTVRADITAALLDQCLRLGPSGLDAGVFTAAIVQGSRHEPSQLELSAYRQRLMGIADLRLSLSPLLDGIKSSSPKLS